MVATSVFTALLAAMTAAAAPADTLKRDDTSPFRQPGTYVHIYGDVMQLPSDVNGWEIAQDFAMGCLKSMEADEKCSTTVCSPKDKNACITLGEKGYASDDAEHALRVYMQQLMGIVQAGSNDTLVPSNFRIVYWEDEKNPKTVDMSFSFSGGVPGPATVVCERLNSFTTTGTYHVATRVGSCPEFTPPLWPANLGL